MSTGLLIGVIVFSGVVLLVSGYYLLMASATPSVSKQTHNLVQQRRDALRQQGKDVSLDGYKASVRGSTLTLEKRLRYAQWNIPPMLYWGLAAGISLTVLIVVAQAFNYFFQGLALITGPVMMSGILNFCVNRRFVAFDNDYPQFLMSLVALIKTGMNPVQALDATAQGMDEGSLVRQEVEMMIDRLQAGVSEDKAIGTFGETVFHPEIELFVQALLLSKRVGGTLSATLERLARQVRKRQHFRRSANAAVGMQRGSIWFIVAILVALEGYLYFAYPEAVVDAIKDPLGWQVWQGGLLTIMLGIYWVRQVTKLKI